MSTRPPWRPLADPAGKPLAGGRIALSRVAFCRDFEKIDCIRLGILLDEQDLGGPAASADFERVMGAAPAALTLADGKFQWTRIDGAAARYRSVDGVELDAQPYSPFDIMSLATILQPRSVRMDLAFSISRAAVAARPSRRKS